MLLLLTAGACATDEGLQQRDGPARVSEADACESSEGPARVVLEAGDRQVLLPGQLT